VAILRYGQPKPWTRCRLRLRTKQAAVFQQASDAATKLETNKIAIHHRYKWPVSETSNRLGLTQPAVSITVRRGEEIATQNGYSLFDE